MKKVFTTTLISLIFIAGCNPSTDSNPETTQMEEKRIYNSRNPEECKTMLFMCVAGRSAFFDETGCGCELTEETSPENVMEKNTITKEEIQADIPETSPEVSIRGFTYSPAELTVKTGTTVLWTNEDTAPHTITSTDSNRTLDSADLKKGESFAFIFESPGTYEYFCALHPNMRAKVIVIE